MDVNMSDDYFFKQLGMEFGPVPLTTIQEMVNQGGLAADDQFRQYGGQWRDVAVLMTRSETLPPVPAPSRAQAAGQAPIDRQPLRSVVETSALKRPLERPQETDGSPPQPVPVTNTTAPVTASNREMRQLFVECVSGQRSKSPKLPQVRSSLLGNRLSLPMVWILKTAFSSVSGSITRIFELIFWSLGSILLSRIALASMIVLLAILLVSKVEISWVPQRQIHSEIVQIWTEYKELRVQPVDKKTWTEFCERSNGKLAGFVPQLKQNARSSDPPSMALLRIAKDYLPGLLNDPKKLSAETEQKIEAQLWVIDSALKKSSEPGVSWDLSSVTILVLDVLVVCVVLGYVGRILWRRTSPST